MSDVRPPNNNTTALQLIQLLPREIQTSQRFNVRPFSETCDENEDERIVELAKSIEEVGQLDPLLISPEYILIAGHRRRSAVMLINERKAARGESLRKCICNVDHSGGDLRRKSILSNIQRKDCSPMDLAYLITSLRRDYAWSGQTGTNKVAEYLGISYTLVRQTERFLCAERALQNQIHIGLISAQSAIDIMREAKDPREQTLLINRATEIQTEDRLDKTIRDYKSGKKSMEQTTRLLNETPKPRIEHPAIVKAIREHHTTQSKNLPLTRVELVAAFNELALSPCSPESAAFASYFATTYALGHGSKTDLLSKFLAISPTYISSKEKTRQQALPN